MPTALWDAAHAFVERRKQAPRERKTKHAALLAGLLFAPDGQKMLHSYTRKKNGRHYRYYGYRYRRYRYYYGYGPAFGFYGYPRYYDRWWW